VCAIWIRFAYAILLTTQYYCCIRYDPNAFAYHCVRVRSVLDFPEMFAACLRFVYRRKRQSYFNDFQPKSNSRRSVPTRFRANVKRLQQKRFRITSKCIGYRFQTRCVYVCEHVCAFTDAPEKYNAPELKRKTSVFLLCTKPTNFSVSPSNTVIRCRLSKHNNFCPVIINVHHPESIRLKPSIRTNKIIT